MASRAYRRSEALRRESGSVASMERGAAPGARVMAIRARGGQGLLHIVVPPPYATEQASATVPDWLPSEGARAVADLSKHTRLLSTRIP